MLQNETNNITTGKLILEKGDWKFINTAINVNANITWESIDPSIVQINPNSGLIHANDVGETTVIGVAENGITLAFCLIRVLERAPKLITTAIETENTAMMTNCVGGSNNVSAFGYSGTLYTYSENLNRVTLEKGFGSKNGTKNNTSKLFRSAVVQMDNLYDSLPEIHKKVWMAMRLSGILISVAKLIKNISTMGLEAYVEAYLADYVKNALIDQTIPRDAIKAFLLGCKPWCDLEDNAISYYNAF